MAGIYVSGGTFSGSGDVTTDWMVEDPTAGGTFTAPDGTLTYVGKYGGAGAALNHCHYARGTFNHNNGTITVNPTKDGGTRYISNTNGGVRDLYSLTLLSGSISASYANDVRYGTECTLDGDLTIDGTNADTNLPIFQPGSQNFDLVVVKDVSIKTGTLGGNANYGTMTLGSMNIQAGGIFDAPGDNIHGSGGTTTMNYTTGLYSVIFRNNGTMIHNSGTLKLNTNTDAVYGGGGGTGGPWDVIATENGAGTYTYRVYNNPIIQNDLTISGNVIYNNNLAGGMNHTVSGNVRVTNSGSYANTGAAANVQTFGSLTIEDTATFITSPLGTTTLTGEVDDYAFYAKGGSTFTANNGTIKITTPAETQIRNQSDEPWHSLEIDNSNNICDFRYNSNVVHTGDLIVNAGDTLRMTGDLSYSWKWAGTATISGTLDGGYGAGATGLWSFGMMDIASGGEYIATKGTTQITQPSVGAGKFYNLGTFTHSNGLVSLSGASQEQFLGPNNGSITFYDLELQSNEWTNLDGAGGAVTVTIENSYNSYNANRGINMTYNNNKLILGSATGSCTFSGSLRGYNDDPVRQWYVEGASELYPAIFKRSTNNENEYSIVGNTTGSNGSLGGTTHVKWVDFSDVPLYLNSSSADGDFTLNTTSGETIWNLVEIPTATTMNCSGQRVTFGGTMTTAADGLIISGALVEMTGTGNWSETGYQQFMGRNSASVIWNSTGFYSPDGGYLNYGWKNALWNAEARVNQDSVFRNTNLIVAGGLDANNRAIGTSGSPTNIKIANGGTISSSTNTFHASNFSNRGGLFTSSSAFAFDGAASSGALINAGADSSIDNIFDGGGTVEGWVKLDSGGGANVGRLVSKDDWFIYFREDSFNNIRLQYTFDGGGAEWYTENNSFTFDNKWHHVAVTYDNSDIANDPTIYLDGKLVPLGTIVRPTGTRVSEVGDVLYVGNNPTGIRTLDGPVGMIRMFSDIRTGAEIRTDMFNQKSDMVNDGALVLMYQFDEGQGTAVTDVSTNSNTGTITMGTSAWTTAGTWEQNIIGTETDVYNGNLYIGTNPNTATIFASSYFNVDNRKLIEGSKFASKSHMGTLNYYIATSGTNDFLNYQHLEGAPIGTHSDVYILANGGRRSYFTFDANARNEQCNILVNAGVVRIVANSDFYTQDFDNSQGEWIRSTTYDGIIHDDGSTPHEYEPIDIMDDQDSFFDTEDLID